MTAEGGVYRYNKGGTDELLGGVDASRFANPNLLKPVTVDFAQHYPTGDTPTQKWFKDQAENWHYVTADGGVYRQINGSAVLLGGVAAYYFSKPNDLVNDY